MKEQRFFSVLLLLLFFIFSTSYSYAHSGHIEHDRIAQAGENSQEILVEESASPSAQKEEENVSYELAYPGMLPDNPLYFLKTLRDKIVRFLISDPLKDAEFDILTANKRVYASLLLAEKEKYELSLETFSKSNNYLHEAVFSLSRAQEKNKDIKPLLGKLKTSVKKHQEVVSRQIAPIIPENMRKDFNREIKRLEDIEKSVKEFASE